LGKTTSDSVSEINPEPKGGAVQKLNIDSKTLLDRETLLAFLKFELRLAQAFPIKGEADKRYRTRLFELISELETQGEKRIGR